MARRFKLTAVIIVTILWIIATVSSNETTSPSTSETGANSNEETSTENNQGEEETDEEYPQLIDGSIIDQYFNNNESLINTFLNNNETLIDTILNNTSVGSYLTSNESLIDSFLNTSSVETIQEELMGYINDFLNFESIDIVDGISIKKVTNDSSTEDEKTSSRSRRSFEYKIIDTIKDFARTHVVTVNVPQVGRLFQLTTGKSGSFMAGFGLGFLAFGLKKLLLPIFIGAQIAKSVMIAMFLPSIIGGLGRLVGKGLQNLAASSTGISSGSSHQPAPMEDFEFKDTTDYQNAGTDMDSTATLQDFSAMGDNSFNYPDQTNKLQTAVNNAQVQQAMNRFGPGGSKVSYIPQQSDNYYSRQPTRKRQDFKIFHKIPSSSLLLTSYDPFYSPLLSRLDAIFQQMNIVGHNEKCRERMVCLMYANPAKYAPFSNLVSAQLSRELNELKKPTSDNPDILRFFKYMKAAKDGQDGGPDCPAHQGCPELNGVQTSPAMLTTFNDINKLVQARKF